MKCPRCGSRLMAGYSLQIQGVHIECTACEWMGNLKEWDVPSHRWIDIADSIPIGVPHFREGWLDAPSAKVSELIGAAT